MTDTVTPKDPSAPTLLTPGGIHGLAEDRTEDANSPVQARGYWEGIWRRFKRDRLALAGAIFIPILFLIAFVGAPVATHLLGHGPNEPFISGGGLDQNGIPVGPMTEVQHQNPDGTTSTQLFILGADSSLARDEFLRLLYGAQISLEVGVGATFLSISLGVLLGAAAGFYRGRVDTVISRLIEVIMAFPYLLFVIAIAGTVGTRLNKVTFGFLGEGVLTLVLVFGFLGWFYSARIFRSVALSLREKEFVEAARMVGSSNWRVLRTHILPHLVGPLIVLVTLNVAGFILAEAGLSYLGLGIALPTASWGTLLNDAQQYNTTQPLLLVWPGIALLLTTLSFNLCGDGLRDAFDPKSSR